MGGVCGGEDGEGGLPAGGADDDVSGDGGAGGEDESGWGEGGDVLAVDVYVVGNRVPEVGALVYTCAVVLPEYAAQCEPGFLGRWEVVVKSARVRDYKSSSQMVDRVRCLRDQREHWGKNYLLQG